MDNKETYKKIARTLEAYKHCIKTKNEEWGEKHLVKINDLIQELPHGSGLDSEWKLDFERSNDEVLVLYMSYHAMNENGMYDGWIDFTLKVKPSLMFDISLNIKGNFGKYQDIKEYLYEVLN